jgi:hypothetical protein
MNETFIQIMDKFNKGYNDMLNPGLCHGDSS